MQIVGVVLTGEPPIALRETAFPKKMLIPSRVPDPGRGCDPLEIAVPNKRQVPPTPNTPLFSGYDVETLYQKKGFCHGNTVFFFKKKKKLEQKWVFGVGGLSSMLQISKIKLLYFQYQFPLISTVFPITACLSQYPINPNRSTQSHMFLWHRSI